MHCTVRSARVLNKMSTSLCYTSSLRSNSWLSSTEPSFPSSGSLRAHSSRRRLGVMASTALVPNETRVLVAGGSGVAMKTARRLRDASCTVYVLQRSDVRSEEISALGATMVQADVLEKEQLSNAFAGIDALDVVVSSVGGTPADPLADSQGNINLIESALRKGVKKFLLVTSIGVAETKDAVAPNIYEVLEPVLLAKAEAEKRLKASEDEMDYVILRPGGLKSDGATGTGILTEDIKVCGSIQREDVADLIMKCIFSEKTKNIVLSAVDKNALYGEPTYEEYLV